MKKKSIMSIIVIAMVSVLMIGATMSWFTDSNADNPVKNTFTAGTVKISANGKQGDKNTTNPDNTVELADYHLNPGDTKDLPLIILNTGSKSAYVRFKLHYQWFNTDSNGKINPNSPSKVTINDNATNLPTDNITFKVGDPNWKLTGKDNDGNIYGYFKLPVAGTIEKTDKDNNPYYPSLLNPQLSVYFAHHEDLEINDNDYQGKALQTTITVEAIQSDHVDKPWNVDLNQL